MEKAAFELMELVQITCSGGTHNMGHAELCAKYWNQPAQCCPAQQELVLSAHPGQLHTACTGHTSLSGCQTWLLGV